MNTEELLDQLLLLNNYLIDLSEIKLEMELTNNNSIFYYKEITNIAFDEKSKTLTFY